MESIEEHYIKERGIPRGHLDWLHKKYIEPGKTGKKSGKGGLYPFPRPGSQTKLFFLDIGMGAPIPVDMAPEEIMHRGQILSLNVDEGGKPMEILSHDYMPDGIGKRCRIALSGPGVANMDADIDHSTGRMYWTTMGNPKMNDGAVHSAKLDGSDTHTIVATGAVHTPKECVIDQEERRLYFCDREGLRVMRVRLDGSDLETLVQNGDWRVQSERGDPTKWCVGIALSKKLGKFF